MPIELIQEPRHARQAIVRALGELRLGPAARRAAGPPHTVSTALPHVLYRVAPAALADGELLARAHPAVLRYLVEVDNKPWTVATTTLPNERGRVEVVGFESLAAASALSAAVEALHEPPRLGTARLELRVLHIPSLHVSLLWLHGQRRDWLHPFGNRPAGLTDTYCTPTALLAVLGPLALRRMQREQQPIRKTP